MADSSSLKILHVLRAPVGGLFRHVLDLAQGQTERGHQVGIVAAEPAPDSPAQAKLDTIRSRLKLGVSLIPMQRQVGLGDLAAVRHVTKVIAAAIPDVVHGHGAKGGAFARLASTNDIRAYTPHGGSLHYGPWTPQGLIYGTAERLLMRRTDLLLFESKFAQQTYETAIGNPSSLVRVIHNGVGAGEFTPVEPSPDATDLVAIGELRHIKGIDVLIEAIAALAAKGRPLSATIVGQGPDEQSFRDLVTQRGLTNSVRFAGYHPARHAFGFGHLLIVASRAESLPYIVLEAAAARVPMVATKVGGIPEIFEPQHPLVAPGDASALAFAIASSLDNLPATQTSANRLQDRVRDLFSQNAMVDGILTAYGEAIRAKFHRWH